MNPDKTREAIAVMQAYVDGKQIQVMNRDGSHDWYSIKGSFGETPHWNWEDVEYRVEPPPPPEPTIPEDFWIVVVKASKRPASMIFTSLEDAKKWIGYAGEYYDIVHCKPVKSTVEQKTWQLGDRVTLARLSSIDEYDGVGGPGWDDGITECFGRSGTIYHISKKSPQFMTVKFDKYPWVILTKDLDPA